MANQLPPPTNYLCPPYGLIDGNAIEVPAAIAAISPYYDGSGRPARIVGRGVDCVCSHCTSRKHRGLPILVSHNRLPEMLSRRYSEWRSRLDLRPVR